MSRTMELMRTFYPMLISNPEGVQFTFGYYGNNYSVYTTMLYVGKKPAVIVPTENYSDIYQYNIPVTSILNTTFCNNKNITNVTIPNSIVAIF